MTRTWSFFEVSRKRRKGLPSEMRVKRGVREVHGNKMLQEKLERNDLCPCGTGKRFKKCCLKSGRFDGVVHGHFFQRGVKRRSARIMVMQYLRHKRCTGASARPNTAIAADGRDLPGLPTGLGLRQSERADSGTLGYRRSNPRSVLGTHGFG